jgi:hypothetical protein
MTNLDNDLYRRPFQVPLWQGPPAPLPARRVTGRRVEPTPRRGDSGEFSTAPKSPRTRLKKGGHCLSLTTFSLSTHRVPRESRLVAHTSNVQRCDRRAIARFRYTKNDPSARFCSALSTLCQRRKESSSRRTGRPAEPHRRLRSRSALSACRARADPPRAANGPGTPPVPASATYLFEGIPLEMGSCRRDHTSAVPSRACGSPLDL